MAIVRKATPATRTMRRKRQMRNGKRLIELTGRNKVGHPSATLVVDKPFEHVKSVRMLPRLINLALTISCNGRPCKDFLVPRGLNYRTRRITYANLRIKTIVARRERCLSSAATQQVLQRFAELGQLKLESFLFEPL